MDNFQIADVFSLLSKLMDIHGENGFKAKSYAAAAFAIEKLSTQLLDYPKEKIAALQGIGTSTAQKIIELIETGKLNALENLLANTPAGIVEMLQIKGIGPKKIHTIWKEMELETIGELLYACKENRLKLYKGFGEKTQQNVIQSIEFYFANKGSFLYAQVLPIATELQSFLTQAFPNNRIAIIGAIKRQLETIDQIEFLVDADIDMIFQTLQNIPEFEISSQTSDSITVTTTFHISIVFYQTTADQFISRNIELSAEKEFWNVLSNKEKISNNQIHEEADYFIQRQLPWIPPFLREDASILQNITSAQIEGIIQPTDIKGIIHCHSNWSDGNNTVEEMAMGAIDLGLEYLVLSDHSKSAFYAQGLSVEKIIAQHQHIEALNKKLYPFKIFKSIESDILNDGQLDYDDEVLALFDLVIASVHSNLKMNEEKAMMRLMTAIENPYTTILGHMTGRLLLSRPGYPVNHKKIIDACAANDVAIELNAHPSRLDIDWREIQYAIEKGVYISINPDAHSVSGLRDTQYGVSVAQKAMLQPNQNLSSLSLVDFENYLVQMRRNKSL